MRIADLTILLDVDARKLREAHRAVQELEIRILMFRRDRAVAELTGLISYLAIALLIAIVH